VYHLPRQKKILIVDGDPQLGYGINSESYYLAAALSDKENKRFLTEIITQDKFENFKDIEHYDIIFLCNLDEISSKKGALLEKFLYCSDKTLFVFLGSKVNPEKYPLWIAENIGTLQETQSSLMISSESQEEFSEIDKFEIDKIVFRKYFMLNKTGATQLLSLLHAPLLIKKNFASSQIYIFASSADMDWSNFPSKSFYPYFIQSIVLREDKSEQSTRNILTVGETIKFVASSQTRNLKVLLPIGEYKPVKFSPSLGEKILQFDETELPGFYRIGKEVFAVNVSSAESNLDKIDTSQLEKLFSASPKRFLKYSKKGKDISQELFAAIEGKELSTEFLLSALVLLGIEIFLSKK
ncbi:MAG: hypothetical protein QME68_04865, partial [Elusimicrobiota bacterium]|nr:hypothetical protein [Elusimicrobiota bacterium]